MICRWGWPGDLSFSSMLVLLVAILLATAIVTYLLMICQLGCFLLATCCRRSSLSSGVSAARFCCHWKLSLVDDGQGSSMAANFFTLLEGEATIGEQILFESGYYSKTATNKDLQTNKIVDGSVNRWTSWVSWPLKLSSWSQAQPLQHTTTLTMEFKVQLYPWLNAGRW